MIDTAVRVLAAVRRLAGDHVQHNAYFKDFPSGVPDTVEFWLGCLREAMLDPPLIGGRTPRQTYFRSPIHAHANTMRSPPKRENRDAPGVLA